MNNHDRFITLKEVETICGFKHAFIYARIKCGEFPPPIKFGTASRWSLNTVRTWMADKIKDAA